MPVSTYSKLAAQGLQASPERPLEAEAEPLAHVVTLTRTSSLISGRQGLGGGGVCERAAATVEEAEVKP